MLLATTTYGASNKQFAVLYLLCLPINQDLGTRYQQASGQRGISAVKQDVVQLATGNRVGDPSEVSRVVRPGAFSPRPSVGPIRHEAI